MKYDGLLIEESLKDKSVLHSFHILRMEMWKVENPARLQPHRWTAVWFEGDEPDADAVAEMLSRALYPDWYCNLATREHSFVVFGGKVFKYPRGDATGRAKAQAYGRKVGLPERQLNWGEAFPMVDDRGVRSG